MNKLKTAFTKVGKFLKKNVYYVLIFCCLAAIGTMVAVTVAENDKQANVNNPGTVTPQPDNPTPDKPSTPDNPTPDKPTPDKPAEPEKIVFVCPTSNYTLGEGYSMDMLVWNATLRQYQTHSGIDFLTEKAEDVRCAYDGTVESVATDSLNGTTVTIKHKDGLVTIYGSLDGVTVKKGQAVKSGDVIGKTSASKMSESLSGNHLHFEVKQNGEYIDPYTYLPQADK